MHQTSAASPNRLSALVAVCRQAGLRVTQHRLELLHELADSREHLDAETLLGRLRERLPNISHDTVYRTLRVLVAAGLIREVFPAADRARFDANPNRHHHFVCLRCGQLQDYESPQLDAVPPPAEIQTMGQVAYCQMTIYGTCHKCLARPPKV